MGVLARLSRRWLLALGAAVGWLAWAVGIRRRVVLSNLALAFPEKSPGERRAIARATFRNLGRMIPEFLLVPQMSEAELEAVLEYGGFEKITEATARGQGVVVCTAHFGNWDLLQAASSRLRTRVSSVSRHEARTGADSLWKRTRARSGVEELAVKRGETLKAAVRALKAGNVLGYVIDQNVSRRRAVFPTFFGVAAATSPTPAYLAMRYGARVFFAVAAPLPGGRYRAEIEGPFELQRSGDREADVLAFMQTLNDRLEHFVRLHPASWYWLHRRWKTRPESED